MLDTLDLGPGLVANVIMSQAAALKSPPRPVAELLDTLREQGLAQSIAKLREMFGSRA